MRVSPKVLAFFAAVNWFGLAVASDGSWKFDIEERGHPELRYSQENHTVFFVGCGRAFGLHAVYPAAHKKVGEKATITIANANTRMKFKGEIEARHEDDPEQRILPDTIWGFAVQTPVYTERSGNALRPGF